MAINTIMPHGMIEPTYLRRGIASMLAAVVMLAVVVYLASASNAVTTVRGQRDGALLAQLGEATTGSGSTAREAAVATREWRSLSGTVIRRAIAARPLDQGIVNVAMVRAVHGPASPLGSSRTVESPRVAAWMLVIARLGWRDTAAQLNHLYGAAAAGDIATVMDVSEALLRRQQMLDRVTPVLAIVETDPQLSRDLVMRLQRKPAWRDAYLEATNILTRKDQLLARYGILRELLRRGDHLSTGEIVKNVGALEQGALPDLGFALLKAAQPGVVSPLNDPDFRHAAVISADGATTVPYDWQLLAGEGFSTEAFIEGGRSALEIKWNGRGVPVFARQRTSARSSRYVLDLVIAPENLADIAVLQFRFVCDSISIVFQRDGTSPTRLSTVQPVPCAFPVLEIVGDVQSSSMPRTLTLYSLRLRPTA